MGFTFASIFFNIYHYKVAKAKGVNIWEEVSDTYLEFERMGKARKFFCIIIVLTMSHYVQQANRENLKGLVEASNTINTNPDQIRTDVSEFDPKTANIDKDYE